MTTTQPGVQSDAAPDLGSSLDRSERRTLEALFRHPLAHNVKWGDVIALFKTLGEVEHKPNNEFSFVLGAERHTLSGPHTKDITDTEIAALRALLIRAGWSPETAPPQHQKPLAAAPNLLIVVDRHEAKIYEIEATPVEASPLTVKPYDPHHFQHHLAHKDQSRERGQRTHEDLSYYERLADGLANAGKIVVAGHGKGHSNAARYLTEYLRTHRNEAYQRIAGEVEVDLSSTTLPQLLSLAREALR